MEPVTVRLTDASTEAMHALTDRLAPALAHDPGGARPPLPRLPAALRAELRRCLPRTHHGISVIRGMLPGTHRAGPTPARWSEVPAAATARWSALLLLTATALGRPIGWEGQQDGRLVHDILPTRGEEQEQTGAGSAAPLTAHTEDAFHPARANLVLLACVRNRDAIPTRVASVRHARLADVDREALGQPRLPILPDSSYTPASPDGPGAGAAPPVATVWETGAGLGLRYDPAYTPLADADPAYLDAYRRLGDELERVTAGVPLDPGDVLVVDNDVVVHGRGSFAARYDGTDRWLRRVSVRVPGRARPRTESGEHGYGQRVLDPWAPRTRRRPWMCTRTGIRR